MDLANRMVQARIDAGLSAQELADKLGVFITTVRNWESGRRQLTLERLIQLGEALGVSVTYLLGVDERVSLTEPINAATLPVLHFTPVWMRSRGWAFVNAITGTLLFPDKCEVLFEEIQEPVYVIPPAFALGLRGAGEPLCVGDIPTLKRIWLEPVTADAELAAELRGWYQPRGRLVENEYGNRFYLDTYGAKWLAFNSCLANNAEDRGK